MTDTKSILVEIPEQGISEEFSRDRAIEFFRAEEAWYAKNQQLLSENVVLDNRNFSDPNIVRAARAALNKIVQGLAKDDEEPLRAYIKLARDVRCVVGQGAIGKRANEFVAAGDIQAARWLILIFGFGWIENAAVNQALSPYRAAALGSPYFKAVVDIGAASQALEMAAAAQQASRVSRDELLKFLEEKTGLVSELERLYREKLVVDEPAKFWASVARSKTVTWQGWLGAFSALIVFPLASGFFFWNQIVQSITKITTTSGSGLSVAGLAVITVPALLYAWLLKNVSRVFLQSLSLADDAAHRRALAITYLGLAENPKLAITETDRALILNALFRPMPPHSGDEGPPMGLIELIKKN